jgi:hypothetical protein
MLRSLCQVVLLLMVGLALLSPIIQRNSPDNFPVAGDDIELQMLCILSGVGIFLLLARWLKVIPRLCSRTVRRPVVSHATNQASAPLQLSTLHLVVPLRI